MIIAVVSAALATSGRAWPSTKIENKFKAA
jgi:hypothetical protein